MILGRQWNIAARQYDDMQLAFHWGALRCAQVDDNLLRDAAATSERARRPRTLSIYLHVGERRLLLLQLERLCRTGKSLAGVAAIGSDLWAGSGARRASFGRETDSEQGIDEPAEGQLEGQIEAKRK